MFTNYLKYIPIIVTGLFITVSCSDKQPVEQENTAQEKELTGLKKI